MATIITKPEEYNKEQPRPTWLSEIKKLETGAGKNRDGYSGGNNGNGTIRRQN